MATIVANKQRLEFWDKFPCDRIFELINDHSSLANFIYNVIHWSTKKPMSGILTSRSITSMTNKISDWNRPISEFPTETRSHKVFFDSIDNSSKFTISILRQPFSPIPALILTAYFVRRMISSLRVWETVERISMSSQSSVMFITQAISVNVVRAILYSTSFFKFFVCQRISVQIKGLSMFGTIPSTSAWIMAIINRTPIHGYGHCNIKEDLCRL